MELHETAIYYNNLNKRKIKINFLDNTIVLHFLKRNYYHLIGLHYISDIKKYGKKPEIKSMKVLNKVLQNDQVIIDEIKSSNDYKAVKERLFYFNRLYWLLFNSKIYRVTPNSKNTTSMKCEYLFIFNINDKTFPIKTNKLVSKTLVLGIQKDHNLGYYIPSTFFLTTCDDNVLRHFLTKREVSFVNIIVEKCHITE